MRRRWLLVLVFESGLQAREALALAHRLEARGRLEVHDAVFATGDADGRAWLRDGRPPVRDAAPGTSELGLLLADALGGDPVGELPAAIARELRPLLRAGDTALALLVGCDVHDVPIELRTHAGARVLHAALPDDAIAIVQQAIGGA